MDSLENEALPSNSSGSASINSGGELVNGAAVVRGKRTKLLRNQSPLPVLALAAVADSSSASSSQAGPAAGGDALTEEEEDMANCLILLAQGRAFDPSASASVAATSPKTPKASPASTEKFTSRRFAEAPTTTNGKAGFYVYECKTCNKCFPSFQALGGHRTSHKKPKLSAAAAAPALAADDDMLRMSISSNFSRAAGAAKAAKVHECSICGSEFSSGQALGGHMRRHRPLSGAGPPPPPAEEAKNNKEKNFLSLDLNLPAPSAGEDDLQRPPSPTALSLAGGNRTLLLRAPPAVVDCHY